MAREITAGVLLKLKDQFSSKIQGAGISVQGFADKAVGVAEKVNKAFSGVAGTLGTLGVSIGALSAVKSAIDLDDRMVRLGLTANADAREVNDLKRQIFEAAQMPDIKLDTDSIISALEVVMTKTGNLRFVEANVRNIALAIQASGESGDAMGAVFSEFAKFGYTMEEILPLMDDLIAQGDQGAFTFGEFAKNAPAVFSAYSAIGTSPEHIRKANAAMQILMAGTKSADIAVTALNSAMAELSDPDKQKKLRSLGINVRDMATKEFRDFNDIMFDIVARAEKMGNADFFGSIFGTLSMNAVRAYMTQGERMYEGLVNLGDTAGLLEQKSATMAKTTYANLQNLQTAFLSFADKNLSGPLQDLTDLLNKLAEDPEKIEDAIRNITITLGLLAGVKIGAGIISLVANLNSLKSGGGLNVNGLANAGGGAGIPVRVTNWGGSGGGPPGLSGPPTAGSGGLVDQYGRPLASGSEITPSPALPATGSRGQQVLAAGKAAIKSPKTIATGVGAGLLAAAYEIPEMLDEIHDIDQDETLTSKEKGRAKGGAIGDASGSIIGAAGGAIAGGALAAMATSALAGTALGTAIPGLGNIAGLIIGAGIGAAGYYFGGKAGRAAGTAIGEAVSGNDEAAAQSPELVYNNSMLMHPGITPGYPYIFQYNAANNSPRIANTTTVINPTSVNDLIITPQGQFNTHPDDYIFAMKDPALLVNAGLMAVNKQYQTFQGAPGVVQNTTNTAGPQTVNDLIITPQGQFNARPDNYIIAMRDPALLANAGLSAVNKQYQTFQEAPGIVQNTTNIDGPQTVDDLLVTPQSQFGAPPGNYNPAMTDPAPLANAGLSAVNKQYQTFQGAPGVVHYNTNASQIQTANDLIRTPALVNSEIRNELRSVERVPPAIPPVIVDGEIELRSELTIDDKGYRLRQSVGKNTTPYKFTVGNVNNARLIQ